MLVLKGGLTAVTGKEGVFGVVAVALAVLAPQPTSARDRAAPTPSHLPLCFLALTITTHSSWWHNVVGRFEVTGLGLPVDISPLLTYTGRRSERANVDKCAHSDSIRGVYRGPVS